MENKPTVLVTGITGFLGSQVANYLLTNNYKVKGTVRSLNNPKKLEPIKNLPNQNNLSLIEADLLKDDCWDKAVEGCTYILHVASPFPTVSPKDENELIKPAVNGTLSVLKAAAKNKNIKHVVFTASIASIMSCGKYGKDKYTEEDWPNMNYILTYNKSKTLAEKAAWDFYNTEKKNNNQLFKLTAINPGYIFGPSLVSTGFSSGDIIRQLITGELLSLPDMSFAIVDVRDVAEAHVKAMESDITDGQSYICSNNYNLNFKQMSDLLVKEFGKEGYKPTTRQLPYFMVWMASFVDRQAASTIYFWYIILYNK